MEYSADSRLTETEITELTEIFIKVYDDGAYDLEEGTKTPSQRKQAKCQFKKTIKNDMKKMSKYYMCIFRTVLEADLAEKAIKGEVVLFELLLFANNIPAAVLTPKSELE